MRLLVILTCYLAAALALVTAGLIGVSVLTAPVESQTSEIQRPKLVRKADRNPGEQQFTDTSRSGAAFRYGPQVNHGRGDTPVNYSQQALREARSVPVNQRMPPYQERWIGDPGIAMGFAPVRSSGH